MTLPLVPIVWVPFALNLLLQVADGLITYHMLGMGIPEANPLVRTAIEEWGTVWGLVCWKTIACLLLLGIFALRHKRRALTIKAFAVTAAVYTCVSAAALYVLLIDFAG